MRFCCVVCVVARVVDKLARAAVTLGARIQGSRRRQPFGWDQTYLQCVKNLDRSVTGLNSLGSVTSVVVCGGIMSKIMCRSVHLAHNFH